MRMIQRSPLKKLDREKTNFTEREFRRTKIATRENEYWGAWNEWKRETFIVWWMKCWSASGLFYRFRDSLLVFWGMKWSDTVSFWKDRERSVNTVESGMFGVFRWVFRTKVTWRGKFRVKSFYRLVISFFVVIGKLLLQKIITSPYFPWKTKITSLYFTQNSCATCFVA